MSHNYGRVTVPTDVDMIEETKEIAERWGADALRDCDGTNMPDELKKLPVKTYSTYYTTRKDNAWAEANPEEIQQVYLMTEFYTAMEEEELRIPIMKHLYDQQLKPNTIDDIKRWTRVYGTIGKILWRWSLPVRIVFMIIQSAFWHLLSGTLYTCTIILQTAGRMLSIRLPLM